MRRTGNKDENKRILMDLDVVLKSHDCPYIIQCYGAIVTNVGVSVAHQKLFIFMEEYLLNSYTRLAAVYVNVCLLSYCLHNKQ